MASQRLAAKGVASRDFRHQLEGYGLTTAQILYRLPDHPSLLQTYVWQDYDLCPRFPVLNRFLAFWLEKLEGPLYSVTVAHSRLIKPAELRTIDGEFRLHREEERRPINGCCSRQHAHDRRHQAGRNRPREKRFGAEREDVVAPLRCHGG